jgi:hypothetical protein
MIVQAGRQTGKQASVHIPGINCSRHAQRHSIVVVGRGEARDNKRPVLLTSERLFNLGQDNFFVGHGPEIHPLAAAGAGGRRRRSSATASCTLTAAAGTAAQPEVEFFGGCDAAQEPTLPGGDQIPYLVGDRILLEPTAGGDVFVLATGDDILEFQKSGQVGGSCSYFLKQNNNDKISEKEKKMSHRDDRATSQSIS